MMSEADSPIGSGDDTSNTDGPTVSVVIPTHNSENSIRRCLDSIARQSYTNLEVIVVDDASRDSTVETVKAYSDIDVNLIAQTVNTGPAAARNAGIDAASGDYIAFMDSDDEWLPQKLERQVAALEANPRMAIVGCRACWLDAEGNVMSRFPETPPIVGAEGWKGLLMDSWLHTSAAVVRASLVGGQRFNPDLLVGEDRDFWIRMARQGEVGFVPEMLAQLHRDQPGHMKQNEGRIILDLVTNIEHMVKDFESDLSHKEKRTILGHLYAVAAKTFLGDKDQAKKGRKFLIKAMIRGYKVGDLLQNYIASFETVRSVRARLSH